MTTPSFEAFQAYAKGTEQALRGSLPAALLCYQRATELDPTFAMAYEQASIAYYNMGKNEPGNESLKKAFSLIDRVGSERERFRILEAYYHFVTGQSDKSQNVSLLYAHSYPRDAIPHNYLAGYYDSTGEWDKALQESEGCLRLSSPTGDVLRAYEDLMAPNILPDRFEEAKAVAKRAFAQNLQDP